MKEVVWIYGPSASGKETFIRKLIDHPRKGLLRQFDWENKKIKVCQASLDYIGQFSNDPVVKMRQKIVDETIKLIKNTDVILIKGQFDDFEAGRPQRIKNLLKEASHKIFIFRVDQTELSGRLAGKKWWNDTYNAKKFSDYEQKFISGHIKALEGFQIVEVDSSKTGEYKILKR